MDKVLLIGGEGYIGNVVALNFLSKKYKVISFDKLLYNNYQCVLSKINLENYTFYNGDILDTDTLYPIIKSVDKVVLLAGLVGDPITKKYPEESSIINDKGVKNVVDICAENNTKRFVFISTCSNYGLIEGNELADENHSLSPLSLYSKSKVNAEKYILSLKGKTKMNPTILRFATAFGISPRMRFDLSISEFTYNLAIGNELLVYDAHTWRPYCHVNDFARLIKNVFESSFEKVSWEIFNAGGEVNNATKQMIVNFILEKIPNGKVKYQKHGSDPRNYRVDFKKVSSILNFTPKYTIQDGIQELINAINKNAFNDLNRNPNFYGNYDINYLIEK